MKAHNIPLDDERVTNLFVHRTVAQRYAAARPYFHPQVTRKITTFARSSHFEQALDVACGTGQSSRALAEISDQVAAVDVSPEMVSEAARHSRIRYHLARAEALPFADGSFNLVTVGLAFHWFDQAAFLNEVHRVLKPGAWLVIYNSGFSGEMIEEPGFRDWSHTVYPGRFPTPPRRASGAAVESIGPYGFSLEHTERFTHLEKMNADQLAGYLLTQTNVIAAVEGEELPLEDAAAWIRQGIRPFFGAEVQTMKFNGSITYLRQQGSISSTDR